MSKRNKLICTADNFQAGWATVHQYKYKDITSDSDNNQKLRQAENSDQPYIPRPSSYNTPKLTTECVSVAAAGSQQQPFRGIRKRSEHLKYDICYHCRSAEHYGGKTAPLFNAANHSSGQ